LTVLRRSSEFDQVRHLHTGPDGELELDLFMHRNHTSVLPQYLAVGSRSGGPTSWCVGPALQPAQAVVRAKCVAEHSTRDLETGGVAPLR
jgi:hypothetical protein